MVLEDSMGQAAPPTVSICIPTYSRHEYLAEAIASAATQRYSPVEILVSDDGRCPAIEEVAKKFVQRDSRVRYWRNEANLGLAGNWNRCVKEARGDYVIIIGDDDRLLADGLRDLVAAGSEDLVFGSHLLMDAEGKVLEEKSRASNEWYGRSNLKAGPLEDAEYVVWRSSVPICGTIIRTALAKQFGFKEDTNTPELILFAELAAAGATFRYEDTLVSEYRIHDKSATSSGLWNDKLAKYLVNIPVSPRNEDRKTTLLRPVLVNAVNRCLFAGNLDQAREFTKSKYYPNNMSNPRVAFQRACLSLPLGAGLRLFRLGRTLKKGSKVRAAAP
jgi:glycosyltransferase involved in cell wall biosynthesis